MGLRRQSPRRIPSPRGRVTSQRSSSPQILDKALTGNAAKDQALLHAMPGQRDHELHALLAFYQEAGADALLGEKPVDRLAESPRAETGISSMAVASSSTRHNSSMAQPIRGVPQRSLEHNLALKAGTGETPPPSPEAAVMAAREAAKA